MRLHIIYTILRYGKCTYYICGDTVWSNVAGEYIRILRMIILSCVKRRLIDCCSEALHFLIYDILCFFFAVARLFPLAKYRCSNEVVIDLRNLYNIDTLTYHFDGIPTDKFANAAITIAFIRSTWPFS